MKRTTLYLDEAVMAFLKLKNVPISMEARTSFEELACEMGYVECIEDQIAENKRQARDLKKVYNAQATKAEERKAFLRRFAEYLQSGGTAKPMHQVIGWLGAPQIQKEYFEYIGNPNLLAPRDINRLVAEALNVHERKPLDDEVRL